MDFNVNGGPGFWRDQVVGGGATPPIDDGGTVTVKSSASGAPSYSGTYDDGVVTLVPTVAIVNNGDTGPLATATGTSYSVNAIATVSGGAITAWNVPANAAVLKDQQASINVGQYDNSGTVAVTVNVAANVPTLKLANATTRIVVNAGPINIKNFAGSVTVAGTIGVDAGVLQGATLPAVWALLGNAGSVAVRNSAGSAIGTGTATVAAGALSYVSLPATIAGVANAVAVSVRNSAGANAVSGTSVVAAGVLTGVNLPATVAAITNAVAITVPVTGTYATKITPTVANGVITGFVLS